MLLYALFFVLWIDIKMWTIYIFLLEHEEAELDQLVEGVDVCLDHPVEVLMDLNLGAYFFLNKMPPSSSFFRAWFKRFFL